MTQTRPCTCAPDERPFPCQHQYALGLCRKAEIRALRAALFQTQEAAKALLAKGEMLAAVVQGAKEEFVRVPYGASHEDVAAINDWHKMAAEALAKWEIKA